MKKTLIITAIVIILGFVGYKVLASNKETNKPTEQELFLDKWNAIGQFKYMEESEKKKAKEALDNANRYKENKDVLLSELNLTGDSGKLSQ